MKEDRIPNTAAFIEGREYSMHRHNQHQSARKTGVRSQGGAVEDSPQIDGKATSKAVVDAVKAVGTDMKTMVSDDDRKTIFHNLGVEWTPNSIVVPTTYVYAAIIFGAAYVYYTTTTSGKRRNLYS